ncbi:zinc finger cchc domain-containing protein [Anaeramoeba flamelloides]|uniref:Zinc finger cchc domain-containing protein n=1 Tax=Anaeramoeba flamelloides TaxID=1746091 RepID=A0AAV8ADE5_9EUKA|nr:zinc finger cchc domain-containing protein [Anaeramoeba flamelloides]
MGKSTVFAEHGGCYLENPEVTDYQCMCKYEGLKVYQYFFLSFAVISLVVTIYFLVDTWKITRRKKMLMKLLRLKFLSLFVALAWSAITVVYFAIDPHQCKRKFNNITESVFYGMGICLPGILLLIIILRWLDLLKASFSTQKHALFKPAIKKFFFGILIFWFIFEITCRIFWVGFTYYIYSVWGCFYTFVCFFGYLVLGTKLNRRLLYGAKLAGSIDASRRNQINQIYKVATVGCFLCITIFFESFIAMLIECFVSAKCGFYMEILWKIQQLLVIWLYLWLAWKGNQQIKHPLKNRSNSNKSNLELVDKRSDSEDEMNNSNPNSKSNSKSNSNTKSSSNSNSDSSDSSNTSDLSDQEKLNN